jgi:hypothetical protein
MEVGGQRHALAALPLGKGAGTHCIRGCVDSKDGLDGCGKISHSNGIRSPDRPVRSESNMKLYGNKNGHR